MLCLPKPTGIHFTWRGSGTEFYLGGDFYTFNATNAGAWGAGPVAKDRLLAARPAISQAATGTTSFWASWNHRTFSLVL